MSKFQKQISKKDNKLFYEEAIKRHGISAQGVHWNSQFTQYKRFEILTKFIENEIVSSSIIDAGCGFGEYYNFLSKKDLKPKVYLGIDCEKMMIDIATKRFENINFKVQNILEDKLFICDYYICSGAMNTLDKKEVFVFIQKCFLASKKAFIFNFLKNDPLTSVKTNEIISFCRSLTKKIKIRDKYLENDFSLCLEK